MPTLLLTDDAFASFVLLPDAAACGW